MDPEIESLRKKIDEIDLEILKLVKQRLETAEKIAEVKRKKALPLTDFRREAEVVRKARDEARKLGVDPGFAESLIRFLISYSWGREKEELEPPEIWKMLEEKFEAYPAQLRVLKVMLQYGLRVNERGEICCANMKIPAVQIAREAGVDRRVVEQVAGRILADEDLRKIFCSLEPVAYLRGAAKEMGMGVIEVIPEDATRPGIVKDVAEKIARFGVSIRQVVADDPKLTPQPKLTIITDRPLRAEVLEALREIPYLKTVIIY